MFLGLSLTMWLILLGVFVIVTPIVGKQIAKDSIRVKNSLQNPSYELEPFILFPNEWLENYQAVPPEAPVQELAEKKYIRRMMMGGIWVKFIFNFGTMALLFLVVTIGFIIYSVGAFFRGIFSTK